MCVLCEYAKLIKMNFGYLMVSACGYSKRRYTCCLPRRARAALRRSKRTGGCPSRRPSPTSYQAASVPRGVQYSNSVKVMRQVLKSQPYRALQFGGFKGSFQFSRAKSTRSCQIALVFRKARACLNVVSWSAGREIQAAERSNVVEASRGGMISAVYTAGPFRLRLFSRALLLADLGGELYLECRQSLSCTPAVSQALLRAGAGPVMRWR